MGLHDNVKKGDNHCSVCSCKCQASYSFHNIPKLTILEKIDAEKKAKNTQQHFNRQQPYFQEALHNSVRDVQQRGHQNENEYYSHLTSAVNDRLPITGLCDLERKQLADSFGAPTSKMKSGEDIRGYFSSTSSTGHRYYRNDLASSSSSMTCADILSMTSTHQTSPLGQVPDNGNINEGSLDFHSFKQSIIGHIVGIYTAADCAPRNREDYKRLLHELSTDTKDGVIHQAMTFFDHSDLSVIVDFIM